MSEAVVPPPEAAAWRRPPARFHLVRFAFLRGLGLIYAIAFAGLLWHAAPLWGRRGLSPVEPWLARLVEVHGAQAPWLRPSLFWLDASDATLHAAAGLGLVASLALCGGLANAPLLALLWVLQLSFVHVGQVWLGYGWETLLLEVGFLAIFLAPPLDPRPLRAGPVPAAVVWLLRWVLFRLYLGAGLIKLRGDDCWRDLTCLRWHYETQPNPHPLSWLWHQAPDGLLRLGVAWNHVVELVVPFALFLPAPWRTGAALVLASFQVLLISSGNLSWLNWLSLVLCLAALDDDALARVLPGPLVRRARALPVAPLSRPRAGVVAGLCLAVGLLSVGPVANLLSARQAMNTSFDPLHLVNSYGAFGSVGQQLHVIGIEGTADDPDDPAATWRPYELPCKPGPVDRAPCLVTPWQPRLDWQAWFAAMQSPERAPWVVHLAWKLVHGEPAVKRLLAADPFPDAPPRAVRVSLYRYRFTTWGEAGWWRRERVGTWLRPVTAQDPVVRDFLAERGWGGP
ncbi:lipase maturation factor family protein [Myxococcota bacterium]|nr:lipase maturation factor family protein [Myxococcota bacterium]